MIWKEHWEVEHLLGKWDLEVRIRNRTYRFFAKDKEEGYAITAQMRYEGEWRVICETSDQAETVS